MIVILNPHGDLRNTGRDEISKYRDLSVDVNSLNPHVFVFCRAAWTDRLQRGVNVSFVIQEESGSGKTGTTKHIMKYFAIEIHTKYVSRSEAAKSFFNSVEVLFNFRGVARVGVGRGDGEEVDEGSLLLEIFFLVRSG